MSKPADAGPDSNTDAAFRAQSRGWAVARSRRNNMSTVWVGNIPEAFATEQDIRQVLASYGEIRRIVVRKKLGPDRSWCLVTFLGKSSALKAIANPPVVDNVHEKVQLLVEPPALEEKLLDGVNKVGALADVVLRVLEKQEVTALGVASESESDAANTADAESAATKRPARRMRRGPRQRRRSNAELTIRAGFNGQFAEEHLAHAMAAESDDSGLDEARQSGRKLWGKVRSGGFRAKLQVIQVFTSQNDDRNEKEAKEAIANLLASVRDTEPMVTSKLRAVVGLYGGELVGLDFRFKSEASMFRKVMSRLDSATRDAAQSLKTVPSADEILSTILDSLRYTAIFETETYTNAVAHMVGHNVEGVMAMHGFKCHRVRNFWGPGDGYQGINSVFICPAGLPFELQFHTPESIAVKEEECHVSYEKFRTASDVGKAMQYWEEMVSLWDMVPVPENILEIPVVVHQALEFDVSMLSDAELAGVRRRKKLEKACSFPAKEMHTRAVRAEPEISSLVHHLCCKHGPNKSMVQKDQKRPMRAHLTIQRQIVNTLVRQIDDQISMLLSTDSLLSSTDGERSPTATRKWAKTTGHTTLPTHVEEAAESAPRAKPKKLSELAHRSSSWSKLKFQSADGANDQERSSAKLNSKSVDCENDGKERSSAGKAPRASRRRPRTTTISPAFSGTKLMMSAKLKKGHRQSSIDLTGETTAAPGTSQMTGLPPAAIDDFEMPNDSEIRDVVDEVEFESPALRFKIVCIGDHVLYTYTSSVAGFIKDIAHDPEECCLCAINNYWDDIEKFGAIQAGFLSRRHGVRFQITFHTMSSWDADVAHNEHMRRQLDTVIKTDTMFDADPSKISEAKETLRREDMWKERWARIAMPDRALTIGTLRYSGRAAPSQEQLAIDAAKVLPTAGTNGMMSMPSPQSFEEPATEGTRKLSFGAYARSVSLGFRAFGVPSQQPGPGPATLDTADAPMTSPFGGSAVSSVGGDFSGGGGGGGGSGGEWVEVLGTWLATEAEQRAGTEKRFNQFAVGYRAAKVAGQKFGPPPLLVPLEVRVAKLEASMYKVESVGGSLPGAVLKDPALEAAAVKLQSQFRGFFGRKITAARRAVVPPVSQPEPGPKSDTDRAGILGGLRNEKSAGAKMEEGSSRQARCVAEPPPSGSDDDSGGEEGSGAHRTRSKSATAEWLAEARKSALKAAVAGSVLGSRHVTNGSNGSSYRHNALRNASAASRPSTVSWEDKRLPPLRTPPPVKSGVLVAPTDGYQVDLIAVSLQRLRENQARLGTARQRYMSGDQPSRRTA